MEQIVFLNQLKAFIITFAILLLPLFFLPTTQDFFVTNKFYLLNIVAIILFMLTSVEILVKRRITFIKDPLSPSMLGLVAIIAISTFFMSVNPTQALLNPYFSLLSMGSLIILFFQMKITDQMRTVILPLMASSIVVALLAIIMLLLNPFQSANFPFALQFLGNASFSPIGSQLDLVIFLGFMVVLSINLYVKTHKSWFASMLLINLAALITVGYFLFKNHFFLYLPPLRLSWYAAIETLKSPLPALFGVGIDNFSTVFTKVKDLAYNQSPQWQIGSFTVAGSTFFHILTETGLLGFISFLTIIYISERDFYIKKSQTVKYVFPFIYILAVMLLLPPSLLVFFLFFISLSLMNGYQMQDEEKTLMELHPPYPVIIVYALVTVIGILFAFYWLGRTYVAEFYMRQSVVGESNNNLRELYDSQRKAILINPSMESYHVAFSNTNSLLARQVANKVHGNSASSSAQLTDQEKQLVAQTVQASINEAKIAVSLNPHKAAYWDNLAAIYRSIINVANEADAWTISAYQRAVVLDPNNPIYRLNLGGVYYTVGNYEDASSLFKQAISLKPDWSNAHYNLAWTSYRKKDFPAAIAEMKQVITLLGTDKNQADYVKAQADLAQFQKDSENVAGASTQSLPQTLPTGTPATLPTLP